MSSQWLRRLPGGNRSAAARWGWFFLICIAALAIFGPLIANERPYYIKLEGKTYFPLFSGINESTLSIAHPNHSPVSWKKTKFESVWYAPVTYSYYSIDLTTGGHKGPFSDQPVPLRHRHWLGTDAVGHDVLAGMIRGCRVSLLIGIGSMLLALLIGVPAGAAAAYWGNRSSGIGILKLAAVVIILMFVVYILLLPLGVLIKLTIALGAAVILYALTLPWKKFQTKRITLAIDHIVMAVIGIIDSFPALFIILIILFIIPAQGWVVVMLTIALIRWPVMARYMRAEVFKIKETNYIRSAQLLNIPDSHILRKHIIPFAFRPVMISFVFGISSAILAESSLSFLGIGLPADEVNWGRLLSQSRHHFDSWWLVFFPGVTIFLTLLSLYTIGSEMQKTVGQKSVVNRQ